MPARLPPGIPRLHTDHTQAATRDPRLREAVVEVIAEFRVQLASWLGERGVAAPEATAAVLGSAIDGLVMQRALDPTLTADAVTPVLARMITQATKRKGDNS